MRNRKEMLRPVWEGGRVFRETFACVEDRGLCSAPFFLEPEKIIRVESYDQTQCFEAGRDCYVEADRLCLTGDSRIPHTGWETFYYASLEEAQKGQDGGAVKLDFGPVAVSDGRFLNLNAIGNPEFVTRWQIAVTYEAKEDWRGWQPVSRIARLPRVYGKLKQKEKVRIVLYGDSISCGCDCSGLYGLKPGQPLWPELLMESLRDYYKTDIEFINTSAGGKDTQWAIEIADVQNVQRTMMERKRYIDLTGNLLNHPNDYLARVQAQVPDTVLKPW